ncbi:MAG: guanine deaminase [Thiofilum sp.]|uniref:guanine deaminase n=1 Tax=Thiofilum sp. TaxID=2212733 RepID=UPI0025DD300B|nr:guanine deaminase [Thiofilum sp.]MBK8454456.1 guanine deaminase [Thiofilum sp.]
MHTTGAWRGKVLHFVADPTEVGEQAWQYWEDGLLWVEAGRVKQVGNAADLLPNFPSTLSIQHYPDYFILPGFIDTHIHYPQTEMVAAFGTQLLEWLNTYTFPVESQFKDEAYAAEIAKFFLQELLRNGTTTALVFGTVHPQSVDAFFKAALALNLRMIAGKVMMDRHAPDYLIDTPESSYTDSKALIERWHQIGRLQYAVTPRFAPTSTPEQLAKAAQLLQEYPDVYLHTHLSENVNEIAWVKELFPAASSYTDVYHQAGLTVKRSVFAHGVHLSADECECLATTQSGIAHCPTSNQFLGSGTMDLSQLERFKIKVGLGTDIGGGTSFSMFKTMASAYEVQQARGRSLDPFKALYLATLGGSKVLDLVGTVGNFSIGNEADFILVDPKATPLLKLRSEHCKTLKEQLFVLNTLGDDRCIAATYSMGQLVHQREA